LQTSASLFHAGAGLFQGSGTSTFAAELLFLGHDLLFLTAGTTISALGTAAMTP
jgi:hypothetical protein